MDLRGEGRPAEGTRRERTRVAVAPRPVDAVWQRFAPVSRPAKLSWQRGPWGARRSPCLGPRSTGQGGEPAGGAE